MSSRRPSPAWARSGAPSPVADTVYWRRMREADESLIGRTVAHKYEILEVLGRGAMGCVYKARQTALDKLVAVKVMHPSLAEDQQFSARFKREAKAASKLDHPSSIRILDYGEEDDGLLFIAMEYVEGTSLLGLVHAEWPLAPARIADILAQVCAALAVAHEMGIIHRDVKPENILVASMRSDDGQRVDAVKVCDFGIAKIADPRAYDKHVLSGSGAGPLTRTGAIVGTPEYMSPEQGRGDGLDPRSDVYSVGVILFQLLTGRVPFEAESTIGIILKHITDAPPDPLSLNPQANERLARVCLKAMSKRPDDRYASARDMRAELRAAVDGDAPLAADGAPPSRERATPAHSGSAHTVTARVTMGTSASPVADVSDGAGGEDEPGAAPRWKIVAVLGFAAALVSGGVYVAHHGVTASRGGAARVVVTEPPHVILEPTAPLAPLMYPDGGRRRPSPGPIRPRPTAVAPVASPPAAPPAPPSLSTTPPVSATPVPDPAALGPYAMGRAWVEIGAINAERVHEKELRTSLRLQEFAVCYREALARAQSHATGIALVNLSIDERGTVAGAVVTDAQFLPEMTGCLQQRASRASVPADAVDSGGGTATVQLVFKNEP
jgi:serine/threonine protein kinase